MNPNELSEDEKKIVVSLLNQLNYTLKDAARVFVIVQKLQNSFKQPGLKPTDSVKGNAKEKEVVVEPVAPTETPK